MSKVVNINDSTCERRRQATLDATSLHLASITPCGDHKLAECWVALPAFEYTSPPQSGWVSRDPPSTQTHELLDPNINGDPRLGSKLDPNSETDSHLANNNLDQSSVANPPLDPSNNPRTCKVGIRRIPPEVTSSLLSIWQVDGAIDIVRRQIEELAWNEAHHGARVMHERRTESVRPPQEGHELP